MADSLTVVTPFASYKAGDTITDPATMLSIITSGYLARNVVTITPGGELTITNDVQAAIAAGQVVIASTLKTLTLSLTTSTVGSLFSSTISGQTAGSTITATSSDGTVLTVSGAAVSGTFSTAGNPTITLIETLAGATGSPNPTAIGVTVAAAAQTPANSNVSHNVSSTGSTADASTITADAA